MGDIEQHRATETASEKRTPEGDYHAKPAVPATTVAVENTSGRTMWVEIAGGTVTAVKIDTVTIGARTSGMFLLRPGSDISITHSAPPTWQWFYTNI